MKLACHQSTARCLFSALDMLMESDHETTDNMNYNSPHKKWELNSRVVTDMNAQLKDYTQQENILNLVTADYLKAPHEKWLSNLQLLFPAWLQGPVDVFHQFLMS